MEKEDSGSKETMFAHKVLNISLHKNIISDFEVSNKA